VDRWSILYQDDRILAVRKPAGIHVHRSAWDPGEPALVEAIEAETGLNLYPAHRLDRPTSGALVFALDPEAASVLGAAFRERTVDKTYWAVVRGWMPETRAVFDVQLDIKLPEKTDAETWFRPLECYEAPWPRRGFPTYRFSLAEAKPVTGRRHQIRQHCDDLRHPILGDTVWGDTNMNGWLATVFADAGRSWGGLHLWCRRLEIPHPDGHRLVIESPLGDAEAERLDWYRRFCLPKGPETAIPYL
jgi:tRNA pseudouridine65 synthase